MRDETDMNNDDEDAMLEYSSVWWHDHRPAMMDNWRIDENMMLLSRYIARQMRCV